MRHSLHLRSAAAILLLAIAGCQLPPAVPVSVPPRADAIPPPANLEPPNPGAPGPAPSLPPPLATAGGWDGSYAGEGLLTVDPGGQISCPNRMPVSGMTVAAGRVRFGDFRGAIAPDGTVSMPFGQAIVSGRFAGGGFTGSLYQPFPGCQYALQLSRTAS